MIGQLLDGRYQVIRVLGAGGFGQTYIAEDTKIPGNPVCVVKQLKPDSSSPKLLAAIRRLFHREAETLAKLSNYDQIPRLLAYDDQEFYLVQEFIEGEALSAELESGERWNENQVVQMLQEVLGILEVVHSFGVIHRDIKPDNIIRRASDNKLVLIDFGAIKQIRSQLIAEQGQVSATIAIGTPGYMPTEQGQGKPRPNSDIYALGIIGIQALTGLHPSQFQEDLSTGEIIWQHQAQVSQELAEVLTKMVRYHFKDRYQSATEAWQAIQPLVNPTYIPTAQAIVAATTLMHELTLEWVEAGQLKSQTLSDKQSSKNPGTIRIGRDPQACDIVLSETTVSRLHVEIFFHSQQQCFYLRSLQEGNPPIVNGQPLLTGEVALSQGSNLRLGQLDLRVSAIALKHDLAGYTPIGYATPPQATTSQQPVAATLQPLPQTTIPQQRSAATSLQSPSPTSIQQAAATSLQSPLPTSIQQQPATSLQSPSPTSIQQAAATSLQSPSPTSIQQQPATSLQPPSPTSIQQQPATSPQSPSPTSIQQQPATSPQSSSPYSEPSPIPRTANPSRRPVRRQPAGSPPIFPRVTTRSRKLPLLTGVSVVGIVSCVGGLAVITNPTIKTNFLSIANLAQSQKTQPQKTQPQKTQSQEGCFAVVTGNLRSEPASSQNNIVESSSGEKLTVTGKQTQKGWVEVKRSNGNLAWAHRDVISNQEEMESCLRTKGSSARKIEDASNSKQIAPSKTNNNLENPTNDFSTYPPINNLDKPLNDFTSYPAINNVRKPISNFSPYPQINNLGKPSSRPSPFSQPSNLDKPTSNPSPFSQPSNLDKPVSNPSSSPQPSNLDNPSASPQPTNLDKSTNSPSASPQPTNLDKSVNSPSSSPQPSNLDKSVNSPSSSAQPNNLDKSVNSPSSSAQPNQPANGSGSSVQTKNLDKVTYGSDSSFQPNDPTNGSSSSFQPNEPANGLGSSVQTKNLDKVTYRSDSSPQPNQSSYGLIPSFNSDGNSNNDTQSGFDTPFLNSPHNFVDTFRWNISGPEILYDYKGKEGCKSECQ